MISDDICAFSMDLTSIKDSLSNLSIHDIKAGVRKVQNGKSRMLDWPA